MLSALYLSSSSRSLSSLSWEAFTGLASNDVRSWLLAKRAPRLWQTNPKRVMRRDAINRVPTQAPLLMIDFDETPVMDPSNGMVAAFRRDKVAPNVSNSIGEIPEHNLIDA